MENKNVNNNGASKWRNQSFCFRLSVVFIALWFAISFSLCFVFYFVIESEEMELFVVNLSTWLFIVPAIVSFGIFNTIPLIIDWIMRPLESEDISSGSKGSADGKNMPNGTANIHKTLLQKVMNEDSFDTLVSSNEVVRRLA